MITKQALKIRDDAISGAGGKLLMLAEAGSGLHGVAIEGTDDHDELGTFIPDPINVIGFQRQETFVRRSRPEGKRSQPGDIDLTLHSLTKYVKLLVAGNPTLVQTLFVPPDKRVVWSVQMDELRNMAHLLVNRRTAGAYLGYLHEQRQRLIGERGQKGVKRTALVDAHGYDTKYAMHMLRLGHQGVAFINNGKLTLPIPEPIRQGLMDVRMGKVTLLDVLDQANYLAVQLNTLRQDPLLTPTAPQAPFSEWVTVTHLDSWLQKDAGVGSVMSRKVEPPVIPPEHPLTETTP